MNMKHVAIGIPFRGEIGRLATTLTSLRANTAPRAEEDSGLDHGLEQVESIAVFLLVDASGVPAAAALAAACEIPQLVVPGPGGGAACLDRLVAGTTADILILLENGAQVGPEWLGRLLTAMGAESRNGVAGPSTNRSRTQQSQAVRGGEGPLTLDALTAAARDFTRLFGSESRPCESVEEFCLAVRRDVVAAIGAANESSYARTGQSWDIDYCARAERAGFQCVWACASYVHRASRGAPRVVETVERRATAPPPLLTPEPRKEQKSTDRARKTVSYPRQSPQADRRTVTPEPPLISCIMPTRDRPHFARQAVDYFLRQDYPNRELLVLDDSIPDGNLAELAASDPRVRLVSLPRGMSIGAKRNRGVDLAAGDIIAQWDDDDWYSPRRLSQQAAPLLAGEADITALDAGVWFDLERWEFWKATDSMHRRLFVGDVHGGTLVFRRGVWQRLSRYPDRSIAEDAIFLRGAQARGARLRRMNNAGLFVYVRHGANSWSVAPGRHMGAAGWQRVGEPDFPAQDRAFYASLTSAAPDRPDCPTDMSLSLTSKATEPTGIIGGPLRADLPLVSCIMPTADRRHFVQRALQYFFQQDYENRELIIVDDGIDAIVDLVCADDPRVRYLDVRRLGGARRSIGAKRNLACAAARGQIILHWDDDDWSSPRRITCQVSHLLGGEADQASRRLPPDVCGLRRINYYDSTAGLAWQYVYRGRRPWVGGNTLAYRKSLWQAQPFADINVGEDARFLWTGRSKQIAALSEDDFVVGLIHNGTNVNVNPKRPGQAANSGWIPQSLDEIRRLLGADWATFETHGLQPSAT